MEAATANGGIYRFGPFQLPARGSGLTRLDDGAWTPVAIGSRGLDLLLLLLRRHGEVLSRDEIMDVVWPGVAVEESNLTVQISGLRRILDHGHLGPSCIQTISGRGYRFLPTVTLEPANATIVKPAVVIQAPAPDLRRILSIIVMPFKNLGGDAVSGYLAASITDELASDLSRLPGASVIAHASAGLHDSEQSDLRPSAVGSRASYVIQGSIRETADQTRVSVQLIDTDTGAHLWAERFAVDRAATTDTCDEITGRLLSTLSTKLIEDMSRRIEAVPPQYWTSSDFVLRGRALAYRSLSAANRHEAVSCFEQALVIDPGSVSARFWLAAMLVTNVLEGWSDSVEQDKSRAERLLVEVLHDDADFPSGHAFVGLLRRLQGRLLDSKSELEIAVALAPNSAFATGQLGATLIFLGHPAAAIPHIEKSLRLAPHGAGAPVNHTFLGLCRLMLGDTEAAISCLRTARAGNPRLYYAHMLLAAAFGLSGELDEAGAALRQAVEMQPEVGSLSGIRARWGKRASPQFHSLCENTVTLGLQRAGLL